MSIIKSFKGKIPMGEQVKINLSTNNGLTGYKISKFQIISQQPGQANVEFVAKIFLTDQTGTIGPTVDFNDTDLLAVAYLQDEGNASRSFEYIIFDIETFNQDIFITIADAAGATTECNFYIELEQFPIDINSSTYHTLKNIRSLTGPGFTQL